MYQNIKSCVKHDGALSDFFRSEIGVRQGENLSPILFSIYLNDLQNHLLNDSAIVVELYDTIDETHWLKLLILLYADDTIIISDNAIDFQNCLNSFEQYCVNWELNPFPNKPWFLRVCNTSLLKTLWEKEKLLITSNFSFSHSVFYQSEELSSIFIKCGIVICKLFQFGRV